MAGKPRESIAWWWNPSRVGVKLGPEDFRRKLKELGGELEVTWDAYNERWCIFMRKPSIKHEIAMGWSLLMVVQNDDGTFRPLDERVLAQLYSASKARWGSGAKYWEAVEAAQAHDRELAERQSLADSIDQSMEVFDHSQISVAMHGKSNGSKFADFHS